MRFPRFHFLDLMLCMPVVPLFSRPLIRVLLVAGAALMVLTAGFAVEFLFSDPPDVAVGRAMGHVQWIKLVGHHVRLQKYLYITRIIWKNNKIQQQPNNVIMIFLINEKKKIDPGFVSID